MTNQINGVESRRIVRRPKLIAEVGFDFREND